MSATHFHVEHAGVRLACVGFDTVPSDEPPILLLHGLAGYAGEWRATAEHLHDRPVYGYDQRGHGASTRRPADTSRAAYVADAVAVIEHLGGGPVILVGQSLGGHTALLTAAARPDLVTAVVLVEAGVEPDPGGPERVRRWLSSWPIPFASPQAAVEHFTTLGYFHSRAAARTWADGLAEHPDGWRPRFDVDVLVDSLAEISTTPSWAAWQTLRRPVLIVRGEHGNLSETQVTSMLARQSSARSAVVVDAGHDLHLDQPNAWCAVLTDFLARQGAPP